MEDTGWRDIGSDATWTIVKENAAQVIENARTVPQGSTVLFRFQITSTDRNTQIGGYLRWGERDIYEIELLAGKITIIHRWDTIHKEQYAQATRKLRKGARYWLKFCLEPDWLMPAHANAYAYLWPDSGKQPKKPTVGTKHAWPKEEDNVLET